MSRKRENIVASTPFNSKNPKVRLSCIQSFDFNDLSPIGSEGVEGKSNKEVKQTKLLKQTSVSRNLKSSAAALRKHKCVPKEVKESASSAVLKELGMKGEELVPTNILSISRSNMFNQYPQMIIISSDEEDSPPVNIFKPVTGTTKRKVGKKVPATATITSIQKGTSEEGRQVDSAQKENSEETGCPGATAQQTPKPSVVTRRRATQMLNSSTAVSVGSPRLRNAKSKQPLPKKPKKVLTDKNSPFPQKVSSITKKPCLMTSVLETIGKDVDLKWTPRSKGKRAILSSDEEDSATANGTSLISGSSVSIQLAHQENPQPNGGKLFSETLSKKQHAHLKSSTVRTETDRKENLHDTVVVNNRTITVDNKANPQECKFTKDTVFHFADLTFRPHSQHKGCVIAKSLTCSSLEIGYIEVESGKRFFGKLKFVTYTVLEGHLRLIYQGKSDRLSPGDHFRSQDESGYQFSNDESTFARLMYIKDKRL